MRSLAFGLLWVAILTSGCNRRTPPAKTPPIKVINVPNDDAMMKAAIEKARETLPEFVRALQAPKASQRGFAIKSPITDGTHTEHMWLNQVMFDGQKYHGTVNNVPDKVTGVKLGSQRSLEAHELSDWMYVDNGRLIGGFTIRAIRDKMGQQERDEFDRKMPFKLD